MTSEIITSSRVKPGCPLFLSAAFEPWRLLSGLFISAYSILVDHCDVGSERATRITEQNGERRIGSAQSGYGRDRESESAASAGGDGLRCGCDLQIRIRSGGNSAGAGDGNVNSS